MGTNAKTRYDSSHSTQGLDVRSTMPIWSIVSSLAGFLFGFDTVVISIAEKTIQDIWQLSPVLQG